MARIDPATELRRPSRGRDEPPSPDDEAPRLRLVASRGQLGFELSEAWSLAPLVVDELAVVFPRLSFPLDLSGGVDAFRRRRGELLSMGLRLEGKRLYDWLGRRLATVLGPDEALVHHLVAPVAHGVMIGFATSERALAFEVVVAPQGPDLRLLPVAVRGWGWT
ncbi:MAG: hypothetical protein AAGA56_27395, partial [Myxococcota bacterium]